MESVSKRREREARRLLNELKLRRRGDGSGGDVFVVHVEVTGLAPGRLVGPGLGL